MTLRSTLALAAAIALAAPAAIAAPPVAPAIEVRTDDVTRFYKLYDATGGRPTEQQLQADYLALASPGLQTLARLRNVTPARIARAIADQPDLYAGARRCAAVLPRVQARLVTAFARLLRLYPDAKRPSITIAVGRGSPVAIAGPGRGVQIGLEAICSPKAERFLAADVEDRLVTTIAHEYVHAQQQPVLADTEELTVLQRALVEGVAEFVGELVSGGLASPRIMAAGRAGGVALERRFAADLGKRDLSAWFDNTTEAEVGQAGYYMGYRIAKAFYARAKDKRAAVRALIDATDAHAILAASGWQPGPPAD